MVVPIERMGLYYARTERIGVRRDCALKPSQVDLKIGEQHTCSGQSRQAIQQVRTDGETHGRGLRRRRKQAPPRPSPSQLRAQTSRA